MKQNRILLCAMSFLIVFNILAPVLYAQLASEMSEEERNQKIKDAIQKLREEKEKTRHPKVDYKLTELEDAYKKGAEEAAKKFNAGEVLKDDNGEAITKLEDAEKKGGGDAAKKLAKRNGRKIEEGNNIRVMITLEPTISGETFDDSQFKSYGGEVINRGSGNLISAYIPVEKVRKIADEVKGIVWIEAPLSLIIPVDSYRSEGLSKVGFSNYSAAGIRGSGVKVAVIDTQFGGLNNAISNGDLPSNITKVDCTGSSCVSTTFSSEEVDDVHGTAVAEIIHDMVPDAQLYLIKTLGGDYDHLTLKNAVAYCKDPNNGIKVINHSVPWFNKNFYDGQCFNDNPVCSVNDAYGNGGSNDILFVKSAGNYGEKHYSDTFTSYDPYCSSQCWHGTAPEIYGSGWTNYFRLFNMGCMAYHKPRL